MDIEPAASIDAVVDDKPLSISPAKMRHHCVFPGCEKEIRRKNEALPITSTLMNMYPILKSWVRTVIDEVTDHNGHVRIVRRIAFDRWHKPCQRSFYTMVEAGMVTSFILIINSFDRSFASLALACIDRQTAR
jgi:hypothetical protein